MSAALENHLAQIRKHLDAINRIQARNNKKAGVPAKTQPVAGRKGVVAPKKRAPVVPIVPAVPRKAPMCKKHNVRMKGHKCDDAPKAE